MQVDVGSYVSHSNQNLVLFLSLCTHSMDEDEELAAMQSSSQPEPKNHKARLSELRSRRTGNQRFNKYALIVHTLTLFGRLLVLGTHVFILFFFSFLFAVVLVFLVLSYHKKIRRVRQSSRKNPASPSTNSTSYLSETLTPGHKKKRLNIENVNFPDMVEGNGECES